MTSAAQEAQIIRKFAVPKNLTAGEQLQLHCVYDNSASPRPSGYGSDESGEMCNQCAQARSPVLAASRLWISPPAAWPSRPSARRSSRLACARRMPLARPARSAHHHAPQSGAAPIANRHRSRRYLLADVTLKFRCSASKCRESPHLYIDALGSAKPKATAKVVGKEPPKKPML